MFVLGAASLALTVGLSVSSPLVTDSVATGDLEQRQESARNVIAPTRPLHGRFLHITDLHPDPHYKTHSSTKKDSACHRGSGPAGIYGAETSDCDSPITLVNATFEWIQANLKDSIDFVVWTGDSARHDNDEEIPRTETEVINLNRFLVEKFVEVFGKSDNINDTDPTNDLTVPIIPTFGNNDILPHNVLAPGPNRWTREYTDVWRKFIPEEQRHAFERGGWFYVEVIPNQLAVFSLNTLYFFDSNAAVDGCAAKSEPGYEHFEWLRIQLQFLRQRGMKAILTGHVPPARTDSKRSWDETCWQKYTLWMHQYRDVIVGSLYGHMNIDHFMLQDSKEVDLLDVQEANATSFVEGVSFEKRISVRNVADYLTELREIWSDLPSPPSNSLQVPGAFPLEDVSSPVDFEWDDATAKKKKKRKKHKKGKRQDYFSKIGSKWGERYSMSHVSPSVVPNYFPSLRVFEYNLTGVADVAQVSKALPVKLGASRPSNLVDASKSDASPASSSEAEIEKKKKKKKHKKPDFVVPEPPSESSPPGPAYSPQAFTLVGFSQYFANLTYINNDAGPSNLARELDPTGNNEFQDGWREGGRLNTQGASKEPRPRPNTFSFVLEYSTANDTTYKLKDLTIRSYLKLARRIGNFEGNQILSANINVNQIDDSPEWLETLTKDRKHKKHRKHHKHKRGDEVWYTFLRRAFVGAVDEEEIHGRYGPALANATVQAAIVP
ncbi:MAG: Endopolyphosphatase [Caeruleum heppii]|nr:MAG: Endopolyphosphatase [Caeruleum heppii]